MATRRARVTPNRGEARLVDPEIVEQAGSLVAYGVPNFPRYATVQLETDSLDYRIVMHVNTSETGTELSGLQLAPRPGQGIWEVELPGVVRVARELDVQHFLGLFVAALTLHLKGISADDAADSEHPEQAALLQQIEDALGHAERFSPRPYRRRDNSLLTEVARVYTDAWAGGRNPTREVQTRVRGGHNGYSTAAAWVRQARAAGLLPPAVKGKAGWEEDET